MSEPKRLSLRKKLAFACVVLAAVFVGAEAYCRWREGPTPAPGMLVPDPERGRVLRPGFKGPSHSGFGVVVQVEVNALGHRDRELGAKPAGGYRIACLGGSTTFGFGASTNATAYPRVLEARLRKATDRPVEVLNAGVHSWNVGTSLRNYQTCLRDLDLDLLVVLHAHNDLYENADPDYAARSRGESPQPSALAALLRRSAALRGLDDRLTRHRRRHWKREALDPGGLVAFERNLRALVEAARADGVGVLLCTFPSLFRGSESATRALFPPGSRRHEEFLRHSAFVFPVFVAGLRSYNDTIRRVGAELGVPVVDLAKSFPEDPTFYVDYVHHTDAGQAEKARLIAAAIRAQGFLSHP